MGSSRPKVENLALILEMYGLDKKESLFFGDASSDYEAALKNKVDFLGIVPGENAALLRKHPEISWYRDFKKILRDIDERRFSGF